MCPDFSFGLDVDAENSSTGNSTQGCDCEVTCLLRDVCCLGAIDATLDLSPGIPMPMARDSSGAGEVLGS